MGVIAELCERTCGVGAFFAQIELGTLGGDLDAFCGVCGALGPKLSGRRPTLKNLVMRPKLVIFGLQALQWWLWEPLWPLLSDWGLWPIFCENLRIFSFWCHRPWRRILKCFKANQLGGGVYDGIFNPSLREGSSLVAFAIFPADTLQMRKWFGDNLSLPVDSSLIQCRHCTNMKVNLILRILIGPHGGISESYTFGSYLNNNILCKESFLTFVKSDYLFLLLFFDATRIGKNNA